MTQPIAAATVMQIPGGEAQASTPTASQIARFNDQLQSQATDPNVQQYDRPMPVATDRGEFRPLLDYAAQAGDSMRAEMGPIDTRSWAGQSPELAPLLMAMDKAQAMTTASMQFHLVAEGVQSMGRNVQTLYQQQG